MGNVSLHVIDLTFAGVLKKLCQLGLDDLLPVMSQEAERLAAEAISDGDEVRTNQWRFARDTLHAVIQHRSDLAARRMHCVMAADLPAPQPASTRLEDP